MLRAQSDQDDNNQIFTDQFHQILKKFNITLTEDEKNNL